MVKLCDSLLSQKKDNTALLTKMISMEDELLDLCEDMASVLAFFKNQRPIFDEASLLLDKMTAEREYLQAEQEAVTALTQIRDILGMQKPYVRIAELPNLIQEVRSIYNQLLELKKQDVLSEIQAAMAEIHQTAQLDQKGIVAKADDALDAKKKAAEDAATMTQLDAMKIQIANTRLQYIKALMVSTKPDEKVATASRSSLGYSVKLKSEDDIDKYVADMKDKLMGLLAGNDVLHII